MLERRQPIVDELSHRVVVEAVDDPLVRAIGVFKSCIDECLSLGIIIPLLAVDPVLGLQALVPIHPRSLELVAGELKCNFST